MFLGIIILTSFAAAAYAALPRASAQAFRLRCARLGWAAVQSKAAPFCLFTLTWFVLLNGSLTHPHPVLSQRVIKLLDSCAPIPFWCTALVAILGAWRQHWMHWRVPPPLPPSLSDLPGLGSPFALLDLPPGATMDEVNAAARRELFKVHPDRMRGASAEEKTRAQTRFDAIKAAQACVGDKDNRAAYDLRLARFVLDSKLSMAREAVKKNTPRRWSSGRAWHLAGACLRSPLEPRSHIWLPSWRCFIHQR